MGLESANIPIPSEVIMPFAGFLASQGKLDLNLVALSGAFGCTIGSLVSYYLGRVSSQTWIRGFVRGPGRILVTEEELERGDLWLRKYGQGIVFVSRLLPVIRTFISFPAGQAGISLPKFAALSFVGSLLWSYFLAWIGFTLGENWSILRPIVRSFDYLIVAAVIIGLAWFFVHRIRGKRDSAQR